MNYQSPIIGVLSAVCVLVVLAAARFIVSGAVVPEVIEIREVEIATLDEPPPPPPPPPVDPPPTPPPPALTDLSDVPDPMDVPLPEVDVPQPIDIPVDPFYLDESPAPLPVAPKVVSRPSQPTRSRPSPRPSPSPRPAPPVVKSHYSASELDGRPRLLHHPSVRFPRELVARGVRAGTVTLEVELSTSGRVSVRRVISASHRELVDKAQYVARGSRFTPPKRRGQPVKAIMRWPITIKQ